MRDASGALLGEPQRFLAGTLQLRGERARPRVRWLTPRQPKPIKGNLADQRDAPSPSQAEGAMPSGAILTKAGAILPNRTATPGEELHWIAPDCGRRAKKSKREKTRAEEKYSAPINGQPAVAKP
jgi:hypothetical protein